jgi:CRP/FNR family transcriptional regulator, cyclic AMP receptor protein
MELISRILDGSIPESLRASLPPSGMFGPRVTQDDKIARLEEVPLLEGCSRKQLKAVAKITEVVEVPTDTVLARQGEPGNEFYLIMDGSARVELSTRRRARLKPGDYFGEMSLLDGEPRSATVIAETPMRLLVIKRRDFSTLLREASELTQSILATLSRRIRQAEQALGRSER